MADANDQMVVIDGVRWRKDEAHLAGKYDRAVLEVKLLTQPAEEPAAKPAETPEEAEAKAEAEARAKAEAEASGVKAQGAPLNKSRTTTTTAKADGK